MTELKTQIADKLAAVAAGLFHALALEGERGVVFGIQEIRRA